MSKPTLNVPGIDPARIECSHTDYAGEGRVGQTVRLDGRSVVSLTYTGVSYRIDTADMVAVANAAIDHWRATGRLFPEPQPEPVECVCGSPAVVRPNCVFCRRNGGCHRQVNSVAEWNIIQAALKAAKGK